MTLLYMLLALAAGFEADDLRARIRAKLKP